MKFQPQRITDGFEIFRGHLIIGRSARGEWQERPTIGGEPERRKRREIVSRKVPRRSDTGISLRRAVSHERMDRSSRNFYCVFGSVICGFGNFFGFFPSFFGSDLVILASCEIFGLRCARFKSQFLLIPPPPLPDLLFEIQTTSSKTLQVGH